MPELSERRRYPRVDCRLPMKYREITETPPIYRRAQSKNISQGGLLLTTDKYLPLNAGTILEFSLPTSMKAIRVNAKVSWVKKIPEGDYFEIGNEFMELSQEEKSALSDYLVADAV